MSSNSMHDSGRGHERQRKDRQIEEVAHDPYLERHKPSGPAVCPSCGVVYAHGHWVWEALPEAAKPHLCPACHRAKDNYPAGHVTLSGPFLAQHRDEILGLLRNAEARAKGEHPLERVIQIAEASGEITITTTDLHLPRRIGEALRHAWKGELEIKYSPDEYLVRVRWRR
jgi:hypothetical protein